MGLKSFLARQASHPSGWFGVYFAGKILNKANASLEDMGLALMNIEPDANILEIGFGNGRLISAVADKLDTGKIIGIDISKEMIFEAKKRNAAVISRGKVELYEASVQKIPTEDDFFDQIFTANTIYFWPDLTQNVQEIYRKLKSGGRFYCALRPEEEMMGNAIVKTNRSIFKNLFSKERIQTFLRESGFKDVVVHERRAKPFTNLVAIGTKKMERLQ